MTYPAKFRYPVYQPASQSIDVTADWGLGRFETTNDPALALSQPWSVAAVRVLCNEPGVFDYDPALADMDLSQFDLVLLSDIEYYSVKEIRAWIEKNKIQRYVLAVGGLVQGEELDQSCMVYRPWWAYNLLRHNEYQDTYQDQKPYMFEALLGARRPHRDYVMMAMDKTGLLDRSIVTYRDCFEGKLIDRNCDQFQQTFYDTPLQWPYVSANLDPAWEVTDNITRSISPYVPWNIYQRSHYSIVCETLGTGTTFFWSEKVTKCLLARRIFVFFGAQGFLARMRQLGFETFSRSLTKATMNILWTAYDLNGPCIRYCSWHILKIPKCCMNAYKPYWITTKLDCAVTRFSFKPQCLIYCINTLKVAIGYGMTKWVEMC